MIAPVRQRCPVCRERFMGSDVLGRPCPSCQKAGAEASGAGQPPMTADQVIAGVAGAQSLIIEMRDEIARLTEADKRWGKLHQRVIEERAEALRQIKAFAPFIALAERWPIGTRLTVEHDGFVGTVVGYYITREGKPGLDLQLDNAKVVHVYGEKWFEEKNDDRPS